MMNFENTMGQEKSSYNFKEIISQAGIKPYVLRFWESEFDEISPMTSSDGDKLYSNSDLEMINIIKGLLFDEKLSIPQAKLHLQKEKEREREVAISTHKVEELDPPKSVTSQLSSLELMKKALHFDLSNAVTENDTPKINVKSFNDEDVMNLVQAKKRLNKVLTKIDDIIESKNW